MLGGCASVEAPKYDAVLVYDQPFDLTYLKTIEALNEFPNWLLEETEKERGFIRICNTQYGHAFDRDKDRADIIVKRVSRAQTSVSLDPSSQRIRQAKELLDHIDQYMKFKPAKIKPPQPESKANN